MSQDPIQTKYKVKEQIWKVRKNRRVDPEIDVEAIFEASFVLNRF